MQNRLYVHLLYDTVDAGRRVLTYIDAMMCFISQSSLLIFV